MNDENNVDDLLDQTQLLFGDIAPLKNPHKQKSKAEDIPVGLYFTLDDGTQLETISDKRIMLGRDKHKNDQIDLDFNPHDGKNRGVSRSHAQITITEKGVFIKDLDSTNGTFINGQQLYPMRKYAIEDGDEIILGHLVVKTTFIFE